MPQPKITLIYGSVRQQRLGIHLARFTQKCCLEKGWDTVLIDPLELDLPLLDLRFGDYKSAGKELPQAYQAALQRIQESDGIYCISAEYNHGIPPALKNFLDHLTMDALSKKMVGMITYSVGSFAGVRVVPSLRETISALGGIVFPAPLSIGKVQDQFPSKDTPPDKKLCEKMNLFLENTHWLTEAIKQRRLHTKD